MLYLLARGSKLFVLLIPPCYVPNGCSCRSQAHRKRIRKLPKWQAASAPQSRHLDSPAIKDMIVKELKAVELATDEDIHATKTIAEDSRLLTASQSNESYLLTRSSSMGKLPEMVQVTTCSCMPANARFVRLTDREHSNCGQNCAIKFTS